MSVENFGKRIVTNVAPAVSGALQSDLKLLEKIEELAGRAKAALGFKDDPGAKKGGLTDPLNWGYRLHNWLTGKPADGASFADRFGAGGAAGGGGDAAAWREAIAAIESKGSGGYAAVGPATASGDRAYGRYQVMGSNIGPWSEAALGRRLSIQEFMASQSAQDMIFNHRFGGLVKQYGNPQDAASAWFTGRPLSSGGNARDLFGTSGYVYADRFSRNLAAIHGGGAGNSTTSSTVFSGPITVNLTPPPGQNADQFTSYFAAALKRQALAAQANRGQT